MSRFSWWASLPQVRFFYQNLGIPPASADAALRLTAPPGPRRRAASPRPPPRRRAAALRRRARGRRGRAARPRSPSRSARGAGTRGASWRRPFVWRGGCCSKMLIGTCACVDDVGAGGGKRGRVLCGSVYIARVCRERRRRCEGPSTSACAHQLHLARRRPEEQQEGPVDARGGVCPLGVKGQAALGVLLRRRRRSRRRM